MPTNRGDYNLTPYIVCYNDQYSKYLFSEEIYSLNTYKECKNNVAQITATFQRKLAVLLIH